MIRRHHRQFAGFTLIELMLVVGLVAILSTIAGPSFSRSISRYRADSELKKVPGIFIDARNWARNSQYCVQVVVTATQITMQRYIPANSPSSPDCASLGAAYETSRSYTFVNDKGAQSVQFTPITFTYNTSGGISDNIVKTIQATATPLHATFTIWPLLGSVRRL